MAELSFGIYLYGLDYQIIKWALSRGSQIKNQYNLFIIEVLSASVKIYIILAIITFTQKKLLSLILFNRIYYKKFTKWIDWQ